LAARRETGWRTITQGSGLLRLALIMTCVALHAMDVFVIATILPSVVTDIGGVGFYAWPAALYITASIMGAASGGVTAGKLGLRRAVMTAATIYLAGSLFCAIAPHMTVFLVGRVAQGLGTGLMVSLAYTMVRQLFDEAQRPLVFAYLSAIWGLAAIVGPMIAGLFAQFDFWRGVYWLTIPVFLALLTLSGRALPKAPISGDTGKLPMERLALLGAAILCVTVSGQLGGAGLRLGLILAAVLGVGGMLWLDHAAKNPLLPSRATSLNRIVGTGYWVFFLMSFSYTAPNVFLPLLAQRLHEVPPSLAGYVSAAMSLGWSVAAFLVPAAPPPVQRILLITGPLCILGGIIGQGIFVAAGPIGALIAMVFLTGLGIGQCHAHITNTAMSNANPGEEALTAGAIPTMHSLGFAFGAATAGLLSNTAGLSEGISGETLTAVSEWIYGFALIPATLMLLAAIRLVWLIRSAASASRS